ncbi:MAG: DUF2950 domain-containing protein [Deltaproteobacteria bacterium]|nr:DUF2950 domain-containing protein [Deltaproteobacteria bacterium]
MKITRSFCRNRRYLPVSVCMIAAVVLVLGTSTAAFSEVTSQKSFSSPEEAVASLVAAVHGHDIPGMTAILGPGSEELVSSGDHAADKVNREKFLKAYEQKNRLQEETPGKVTLYIGVNDWPMPIPIVKADAKWAFDAREGREEILNRRIGRNELYIIDVLHAYVDAQHEYATRDREGAGAVEFAERLVSTHGKHDGLYWEVKEGEDPSPLGPLVAQAAEEGYANEDLSPFHGYYFKILKKQGEHANGGAFDYVVQGKMILGFGLVAYPAEYGNSGIMTFIVNQEGVIHQKNLGEDTKDIAQAMDVFDPDASWTRAEQPSKEE